MPMVSPSFRTPFRYSPGDLARVAIVGRGERGLARPAGNIIVQQNNLDPRRHGLVERRRDGRIDRSDGNSLHALGDHGFDQRDLAFDIGAGRPLAKDDLNPGIGLGPGLGGVFHGRKEFNRELGDEADLDGIFGHRGQGPARQCHCDCQPFQDMHGLTSRCSGPAPCRALRVAGGTYLPANFARHAPTIIATSS